MSHILSLYFPPLCFLSFLTGALQFGDTLWIFMALEPHRSVVIGPTMTLMLRKRSGGDAALWQKMADPPLNECC